MGEEQVGVGDSVHFYYEDLGFCIGPTAAIVTRVYEMADKSLPETCVDLAIFPSYMNHGTPTKACMVWHRDSPQRDRDPRRWWQRRYE